MATADFKLSVAPMMDWTDRHDRYFLRLISKYIRLYTEMVPTPALIHGDQNRFLDFNQAEQPVALQLGGSDPAELATCAKLAEERGYAEVNLNVGCPSDRVQSGRFGACLMAEPAQVRDCVAAMVEAVDIPVTVKCRIGIDDNDHYDYLDEFVTTVRESGCDVFLVHARVAILKGLSPKQNREVPPLHYDHVYRLKQDYPELTIVLNGGVKTLDEVETHLEHVDGVMLGREAYHNPFMLAGVDQRFYGDTGASLARAEIMERFIPYIEAELLTGQRLSNITRHILGLYAGEYGGRAWRRHISNNAHRRGADINIVRDAAAFVEASEPEA